MSRACHIDNAKSETVQKERDFWHFRLIVGILMAGFFLPIGDLLGGEASTGQKMAPASPALPISPVAAVADGAWSIAGSSWDLRINVATDAELDGRLSRTPVGPSGKPDSGLDHIQLLELMKDKMRLLGRKGPQSVYGFETLHLKVRMFSYLQGQTEIPLGGYLAYPREPGSWTVLTATPSMNQSHRARYGEFLMPLPAGYRRVCTRRGLDGKLQCDVVTVPRDIQSLLKSWKEQGWKVTQPKWANLGDNEWLCYRGKDCVQVTARPGLGGTGTGTALILVDANAVEQATK